MDKDLKDVCEQLKSIYGSHMAVAKRIGYVHDHYCAMRSDRVPTTRRAEKAILFLAHEAGICKPQHSDKKREYAKAMV